MSLLPSRLDRRLIVELGSHFVGRRGEQVIEGPFLPAVASTSSIGSAERPWKEGHFDYVEAHVQLHAAIFSYDQINAVNGQLIVSNATQLGEAVQGHYDGVWVGKVETWKVKDPVFTYDAATGKGSLLIAKDFMTENGSLSIHTEYMLVRSNAGAQDADGYYSYAVQRGYGGAGNPVAWPKDTVLTELGRANAFGGTSYNQGAWDGGWVHIIGTGSGGPSVRVRERTGTGPTSYKDRVVLGALATVVDIDLGAMSGYGLYVDGGKEGGRVFLRGQLDVIGDSRISRTLTIGSPVGPGTTFYDGYAEQCFLTKALNPGDNVALVDSTARFASSGTAYAGTELFTYSGKTPTTFTGLSTITVVHNYGERIYQQGSRRRYGMEMRTEENKPYWSQFFDVKDRYVYWRVQQPGLRGAADQNIIELVKEAGLASLSENPALQYYHLKISAGALFGAINAQNVTITGDLSALTGDFGEIRSAAIMVAAQEYNDYLVSPPGRRGGLYMWNLPTTSTYYAKYNPPGHSGLTRGFEFWRTTGTGTGPDPYVEVRQARWDFTNGRLAFGPDDTSWLDQYGYSMLAQAGDYDQPSSTERIMAWRAAFGSQPSSYILGRRFTVFTNLVNHLELSAYSEVYGTDEAPTIASVALGTHYLSGSDLVFISGLRVAKLAGALVTQANLFNVEFTYANEIRMPGLVYTYAGTQGVSTFGAWKLYTDHIMDFRDGRFQPPSDVNGVGSGGFAAGEEASGISIPTQPRPTDLMITVIGSYGLDDGAGNITAYKMGIYKNKGTTEAPILCMKVGDEAWHMITGAVPFTN